jgi:hypothetical protein
VGAVTIWKTAAAERIARKLPSWSGHFAWGVTIMLALYVLGWHHAWAWLASMGAGIVWEVGLALCTDDKDPATRASVVDALFWIGGAVVAVLFVILVGKPCGGVAI